MSNSETYQLTEVSVLHKCPYFIAYASATVAKSTEFSYQELAKATNNFSLENKIGQGGFGAVYYAELRGKKTAIKKMDVQEQNFFVN